MLFSLTKLRFSTKGLGTRGFCTVSYFFKGVRSSGQRSQTLFQESAEATLPVWVADSVQDHLWPKGQTGRHLSTNDQGDGDGLPTRHW